MNIPVEEKKAEAVSRMKRLGIYGPTIKQFEKDGLVSVSEPPFGAFYWADDEDKKRIRAFEEENDALVYVVVRSFTTIGKMDAYLYVSDLQEEWEMDNKDIEQGLAMAWVYNHDTPDFSEFGYIAVERTAAAGLRRTY